MPREIFCRCPGDDVEVGQDPVSMEAGTSSCQEAVSMEMSEEEAVTISTEMVFSIYCDIIIICIGIIIILMNSCYTFVFSFPYYFLL